ncbi:methyltransferase [Kibdelosporangium aridum]|uniref:Dimerisation domain-containing protein n=1 Tax=Kibdelosporangium aridum TaxID=2030 RepID=A0A1W2FX76_KIBAR|nr:methyltransferase [Kibdelosporangium aridum]SMD26352.1 Dimerisation domain-containing protein [Kibdelosporangium aridum]
MTAVPGPFPLMELSSGVFAAKTLSVAVRMELFALIAEQGGLTAEEFAAKRGLHPRPAEMLLIGCTSLGLLVKDGSRYTNSLLSQHYLLPRGRYYFGDYILMLDERVYDGWMKLSNAVTDNRPTTWDPRARSSIFDLGDPGMVRLFWRAMHSLSVFTAQALAQAYDFSSVRKLLDVGGGGGAYTIELCRQYPQLTATVYDLPFVCEQTSARIAEVGLSDRITCVGGDFFNDAALPEGHDAALLSSVLHDWSAEENLGILRKVHAALPAGGRIIVSELLMDDDKTGPVPAAMFNLLMLVETERGQNYTGAEYAQWLTQAGCTQVVRVDVPGISANAVMVGTV